MWRIPFFYEICLLEARLMCSREHKFSRAPFFPSFPLRCPSCTHFLCFQPSLMAIIIPKKLLFLVVLALLRWNSAQGCAQSLWQQVLGAPVVSCVRATDIPNIPIPIYRIFLNFVFKDEGGVKSSLVNQLSVCWGFCSADLMVAGSPVWTRAPNRACWERGFWGAAFVSNPRLSLSDRSLLDFFKKILKLNVLD